MYELLLYLGQEGFYTNSNMGNVALLGPHRGSVYELLQYLPKTSLYQQKNQSIISSFFLEKHSGAPAWSILRTYVRAPAKLGPRSPMSQARLLSIISFMDFYFGRNVSWKRFTGKERNNS